MKFLINVPPSWKPKTTLLGQAKPYAICITLDFNKQYEWTANEWREYARLLNEELELVNKRLSNCQSELNAAKFKASRRSKPIKPIKPLIGTLLTTGYARPKKGRPNGSGAYSELARMANDIKDKNPKENNSWCALQVLISTEPSVWRAKRKIRGVVNEMIKQRKTQNI